MSAYSKKEELVRTVLEWLQEYIAEEEDKPATEPPGVGQKEALVVAASCISSYFGVNTHDDDDQSQKRGLATIFEAGCRALAYSHDLNERFSMAKSRVSGDARFVELYEAAEDRGYFDGCSETEYQQKFIKLANKLNIDSNDSLTQPPSPHPSDVKQEEVRHAVSVVASCLHDPSVAELAANLLIQDPIVLERLLDDPRARPAARQALAQFNNNHR